MPISPPGVLARYPTSVLEGRRVFWRYPSFSGIGYLLTYLAQSCVESAVSTVFENGCKISPLAVVGTVRCKEPESCWWFIKDHFLCGLTKLALDALDVLLVWIKNGRFVWSCRRRTVLLVNQRWLLSLRNRLAPAPHSQPPHPFHCYPFYQLLTNVQCPLSILPVKHVHCLSCCFDTIFRHLSPNCINFLIFDFDKIFPFEAFL